MRRAGDFALPEFYDKLETAAMMSFPASVVVGFFGLLPPSLDLLPGDDARRSGRRDVRAR